VLAHRAVGVVLGVEPSEVSLHARCPVCGGAHGKPVVVGQPEIGLSIAHAGECVGVAVAEGAQVGLDVEREIPLSDLLNPGAGVLHPLERDALAALPPGRRTPAFLRCWTRKEAVLKATGEALTTAMDALRVSAPDEPPEVLQWPEASAREVRLHDLEPGPGYAACVAALTDRPLQVRERTAGRR
jgi:4'-phosphopantetheinyl transferase